jgi:hypothetical protein
VVVMVMTMEARLTWLVAGVFSLGAELSLDEALRVFLAEFRLPGEAQKIDRLMEAFAAKYCADNPQSVFPNTDAAYILSFSVIMLNTDAHNPAIQQKVFACRVPCAVCRVPCAVCRVPCAVCRVPCAVCRVPCALLL